MKFEKNSLFILLMAVLLCSCDLLGIGRDDDDNTQNSTPSLIWKKEDMGSPSVIPPLIENESVYLQGLELMKVDMATGTEDWSTQLQASSVQGGPMLLTESTIVVNQPEKTKAFKKSDGQLIWETKTGTASNQEDPQEVSSSLLVQTTEHIFVGNQKNIIGLNKTTGVRDIDVSLDAVIPDGDMHQITELVGENDADPLLFVGTEYLTDNGVWSGGSLIAMNADDGNTRWSTTVKGISGDSTSAIIADLVLANNSLIVLTSDKVLALETDTGDSIWQTPLDEEKKLTGSQLVSAENSLFVGTAAGTVLRLDDTDGIIEWRSSEKDETFSIQTGPMTWDGGNLYYPEFKDEVFSIRVIKADEGVTKRTITASDIKNVGFDFDFLGGMSVQIPYLIKQGALNAYGVKLQDD